MYTGEVVRRSFVFILAVLLTATPALGVVCEIDCDQRPATSDSHCHGSEASDTAKVTSGRHACDHDHAVGGQTFLVSSNSREVVGSVAAVAPATLHSRAVDARVAIPAMHGPPGLSARNPSFRITILRI